MKWFTYDETGGWFDHSWRVPHDFMFRDYPGYVRLVPDDLAKEHENAVAKLKEVEAKISALPFTKPEVS